MDINIVVDSAQDLPPTPQILPKLRTVLRDPDAGLDDIEKLIRVDAPLTARVVRLSNSGSMGCSNRCENLREAVGRLGFAEVYRVVAAASTQQILGAKLPVYNLDSGELWLSSITRATLMKAFAKSINGDPDHLYTLGLLSELGKVVINAYFLKRGLEVYSPNGQEVAIPEMENQLLGFNHAQVGARVLEKWGFSTEISQPIAVMFTPLTGKTFLVEACLLYISAECARAKHIASSGEEVLLRLPESVLDSACLTTESAAQALAEAEEELQEMRDGYLDAA